MENKTKEAISQASGIITIFQFVISIIIGLISRIRLSNLYAILIGIGTLFLSFLVLFLFKSFRERISIFIFERWRYFRAPKKEKVFQNKVAEYTYYSRETMSMRVSYNVKFQHGAHNHIEDKCAWTAGKVNTIESICPHQVIRMVPKEEKDDVQTFLGYQYFEIRFVKSYSARDGYIESGFNLPELIDQERKAQTCLIAGIYDKTYMLTLRLRFSSDLHVSNVRKLKYIDYLDEEPYFIEKGELKVDEQNPAFHYVEFIIPYPIYGGKCAIDWEFD